MNDNISVILIVINAHRKRDKVFIDKIVRDKIGEYHFASASTVFKDVSRDISSTFP